MAAGEGVLGQIHKAMNFIDRKAPGDVTDAVKCIEKALTAYKNKKAKEQAGVAVLKKMLGEVRTDLAKTPPDVSGATKSINNAATLIAQCMTKAAKS